MQFQCLQFAGLFFSLFGYISLYWVEWMMAKDISKRGMEVNEDEFIGTMEEQSYADWKEKVITRRRKNGERESLFRHQRMRMKKIGEWIVEESLSNYLLSKKFLRIFSRFNFCLSLILSLSLSLRMNLSPDRLSEEFNRTVLWAWCERDSHSIPFFVLILNLIWSFVFSKSHRSKLTKGRKIVDFFLFIAVTFALQGEGEKFFSVPSLSLFSFPLPNRSKRNWERKTENENERKSKS